MRILVAEPVAAEGLDILRDRHDVDVRTGLSPEELRAIVGDYDALVVRSQVQADAELIAAGSRLVVIGRAGVGVDNVDRQHHRGRRAHAGAHVRAREAHLRGGRLAAPR
jgi:D-3-phosphoglycerate dehydrogenase